MNDLARHKWLLALVVCGMCLVALAAALGQTTPAVTALTRTQNKAAPADPGEKIYAANCARCHTPPMTLDPRVTGTILMHMRTRARLSSKDQKLLLQYLSP